MSAQTARTEPVGVIDSADQTMAERATGVLPSQALRHALRLGVIRSPIYRIPAASAQPASVDLRLGDYAYRLQCSFLAGEVRVEERLADLQMGRVDLRDGAILERDTPYLVPLMEELYLPDEVWAKANPKSSTGRVDVFTRVITDHSPSFDEIRHGYRGRLYLEIVSSSFPVKVQTGLSLNQLRLFVGDALPLTDEDLLVIHDDDPLLFSGHEAIKGPALPLASGLFLGIDLEGSKGEPVGYKARKNTKLLDLTAVGNHDPSDFWEPVYVDPGLGLILEREEFYLLLSKEAIRIPPDFAAEMVAYDPTAGELRTHYAGFFDPGFGHGAFDSDHGARAALEVRVRDVPFLIDDGQKVCKLEFERMLAPPDLLYGEAIGSHYQRQEITLSKHFKFTERPSEDQLSLLVPDSGWEDFDWHAGGGDAVGLGPAAGLRRSAGSTGDGPSAFATRELIDAAHGALPLFR